MQQHDSRGKRVRLKIFFGAAAGVGKTYAMISDAKRRAMYGLGVLALYHDDLAHLLAPAQRQLLEAVVDQISLAMGRDQLAQSARKARLEAESENLRSSLLSSVSHDLRIHPWQ